MAEANMAIEGVGPTPGEYIKHHLTHLTNTGHKQASIVDFSVLNMDSIVIGAILGLLSVFILWLAARKATAGVPGRFQAAVEILVELVENQARA